MKSKYLCPYCSRKVKYFTRLVEHNLGEHKCKHCKKKSNISQNKTMWLLLLGAVIFAALIMIFYFVCQKSINRANEETGAYGFLCFLFFGKATVIKWIMWEAVPFLVFYFVSPFFITYKPQQRFVEQTTSSIDLDIPNMPSVNNGATRGIDGGTKIIPKADEGEFVGEFEDISSSSDIEKTRAFDVNNLSNENININNPKNSVSASYSSDTPLKRINHEVNISESVVGIDENDEVYVNWEVEKSKYTSDVIEENRENEKVKTYEKNSSKQTFS